MHYKRQVFEDHGVTDEQSHQEQVMIADCVENTRGPLFLFFISSNFLDFKCEFIEGVEANGHAREKSTGT
jgi:hypothetical protein